jgi:hypothetical protein
MSKTFGSYQEYIALLAVRHKKLLHSNTNRAFFRHSEEITKSAPVLVKIQSFVGSVKNENVLVFSSDILFLCHVPSITTGMSEKIEDAQEKAYVIMMDFWSRIYKETEDRESIDENDEPTCAFIEDLLTPSFTLLDAPTEQNMFGWQMTLRFSIDAPDYNENNWN